MPLSTTIQPIGFYEAKSANHHLSKGRGRATPSCPVASQEKPLPEYLCVLQGSDRRKARAPRRAAGAAVKTIKIHLHPVEAEMLKEVQKGNRRFRDMETLLLGLIRDEYAKTPAGRSKGPS